MASAGVMLLLVLAALLPAAVAAAATTAAGDCEFGISPSMRGAANQLAAAAAASACSTNAALLASSSSTGGGTAAAGPICDASLLANEMKKHCSVETNAPGPLCCFIVVMSIELDCLCTVEEAFEFAISDLSVSLVWSWYKACGGRRRSVPEDDDSCQASAPPPPPPAPEVPSGWWLWVALVLLCVAAAAAIAFVTVKLWLWLRRPVNVPAQTRHQGVFNTCAGQLASAPSGSVDAASTAMTEVEASPHVSPPRVEERREMEERSQEARPRLPSAPPFLPLPPAVVPRDTLMPGARPPPAIINAPTPAIMAM